MFCTNCGKEITGAGKFCSNCGAPVENNNIDSEVVPDESHAPAPLENDPDILTCPHCGSHDIDVSLQQTEAKTKVKKKVCYIARRAQR